MSGKQFVNISIGDKTLNININISELAKVGTLNISLNDLNSFIESKPPVVVAQVVDDSTNVTMRKKTKKNKKPLLIIEDDADVEIVNDTLNVEEANDDLIELCRPVTITNDKPKQKLVKSKYSMDADQNLICPFCSEYKAKKPSTMSEHVRQHHATESGREVNPYKCRYAQCSKGFTTKSALQHHVKTFHEITYLKCPHPNCEYGHAKNNQTLYTHYGRLHMDNKSLTTNSSRCNDCGEEKGKSIYYHLATCHKSSPFYKACC
jgi:hypothetical protein